MRLTEAIRSALSAIGANALRSLLTMLGIVIGVAAVIAMVAIGAGARNLVDRQIRSLGANLAIVTPGNVTQGGARLGAGAASTLTDEDAAAIKREIEGVVAAAPFVRGNAQVVYGGNNWAHARLRRRPRLFRRPRMGRRDRPRLRSGGDPARRDRRAARPDRRARTCSARRTRSTQVVRVRNVPFRVIGVMASKGQSRLRPGPGRRDLRAARRRAPPGDRTQLRQGRARSARSS